MLAHSRLARNLMIALFLLLAGAGVIVIDMAIRFESRIARLLRDQIRTPDLESLVALHGAQASSYQMLGGIVLALVVVLGIFQLRLLRTDSRVRENLAQAQAAREAADSAWHKLDEAIESLSEGFVIYDEHDRLVRANRKYLEIYACSAQWIVPGNTFEQIIRAGALAGQYEAAASDPETWVAERLRFRATMRQRDLPPFEQQLAGGRWLMVSDRAMSNGGTVGIRTDITELKRNVMALERTREDLAQESARAQALAEANRMAHKLLDDAITALSEGFALWDGNDRLVTCNARYIAVFPKAAHLLAPGVHYAAFIRAALEAGHLVVGEGGVEATLRARFRRRRLGTGEGYVEQLGDGRWLRVTNRQVEGGGIVTVFADITEHKRREIELTEARNILEAQAENMRHLKEQAEAANAAKSSFLAMISHEIRTPMNAVLGLSGLLAETTLDNEQRRFVEGIEDSGTHLIGLINDLLDYTRLEAEKAHLDPSPVSLRAVIGGATRMMRVLAQKKALDLNVEVAPDLPDVVEIDAARFSQVLINLLGNAIKFTEAGAVSLNVQGRKKGGHLALHISVSDTGRGVPEDVRLRLFTPFERAVVHERGQVSGTGLGLAITARLLNLMGGTISLRESGPGATFDMALEVPLATSEALPSQTDVLNANPIGAMHILVAEDTPASQLVIRTLLERRGHRVELVGEGDSALEEATRGGFDLVLLDLQMPNKSGFEVVRAIRMLPAPFCQVPVVALSALASPADRAVSLEAGFDDHLGKPLRVEELDRLIARLAHGEFERAPSFEEHYPPEHGRSMDMVAADATGIEQAVAELRAMCDDTVMAELVDLALMNIESEQESLAAAGVEADYDRMRKAAHKLSGVLAQYGAAEAARLASLFERAEEAVMHASLAELSRNVDAAHLKLAEVRTRLAV